MALPWKLHGDGNMLHPRQQCFPKNDWGGLALSGSVHSTWSRCSVRPSWCRLSPAFLRPRPSFSGLGTLLFLLITGNRLPSYLGSSFAFIAPIGVATAAHGDLGAASFGLFATGLLLFIVGVIVHFVGTGWINALMPPVVMGSIVALIGFNLAPAVKDNFSQAPIIALVTIGSILLITVLFRGLTGRLSIVLGVIVGYLVALFTGAVDTTQIEAAAWVGLPEFHAMGNPFSDSTLWGLLSAFLPVVLVLVAENVGHVKSVGLMIERDLDPVTGRALFADGLSTMIAGFGGGSGTTTYGENIGVMAATRVFSTAAYWVAGMIAVLLSFSPKIGAVINSIPAGVLGGVTVALYGLIGLIGIKIWIDNNVNFNKPINQFTAAVALIVGIADFLIEAGDLLFNGIALGTVSAIVVYHLMRFAGKLRGVDLADDAKVPGSDDVPTGIVEEDEETLKSE